MGSKCRAVSMNAAKGIIELVRSNFRDLSKSTGTDVAAIVTDFATVYHKLHELDKGDLDKTHKYKLAITEDVDGIVKELTNGAFKTIGELALVSDPIIARGIFEQVRSITNRMIRHSKDSMRNSNASLSGEFKQMVKGMQYANSTGLLVNKITSLDFIRKILPKKFEGLLLAKDVLYRQNSVVDHLRMFVKEANSDTEGRTTSLMSKFAETMNNNMVKNVGIPKDVSTRLLKYFDADVNKDGKLTQLDAKLEEMITDGIIKAPQGKEDTFKSDVIAAMKDLYKNWKLFNYGTLDESEMTSDFKHWTKYPESYTYHIIKSGSDYVRSFNNHLNNNLITFNEFKDMDNKEKAILSLFAKYYFDASGEDSTAFSKLTGIDVNSAEKAFKIKKDYVPFMREDRMIDMFSVATDGNGLPKVAFLAKRENIDLTNDKISIMDNIASDLTSFKGLMVRSSELMFARSLNNLTNNSESYAKWAAEKGNSFAARILKIHAQNVIDSEAKAKNKKTSKGIEMYRQFLMSVLAADNGVTLMFSGSKNRLQGMQTQAMNLDAEEMYQKSIGDMSMKKAKDNAASNPTEAKIANLIDSIMDSSISGRRAEVFLDNQDEGNQFMNKCLQKVFDFTQQSNMYGPLTIPRYIFNATTGKSTEATNAFALTGMGKWLTNYGSEKALRSWRKNEAFAYIKFQYALDQQYIKVHESNESMKEEVNSIKSKWNDSNINNTIYKLIDENRFALYEKDAAFFGDFGPDTKPFWSHVWLRDEESIIKITLGFLAANWYMFRQASNFGMTTAVSSVAKAIGEIAHGSKKGTAPIAAPAATLALLLMDVWNTVSGDENGITSGMLQALNQGQDIGLVAKSMIMFGASAMNMNLNENAFRSISAQLERWGGGMLAGKSLQSIHEDIEKGLTPCTTMMQSWSNMFVHTPFGFYKMFTAKTAEDYSDAKQYIRSGLNVSMPVFDNILGGNNDVLTLFVKTLQAGTSAGKTILAGDEKDKDWAVARNKDVSKLINDMLGISMLNFTNNLNMLKNKEINDEAAKLQLMTLWDELTDSEKEHLTSQYKISTTEKGE